MNEYMELFGSIGKLSQLTEREFYALAVLIYCDIDTSSDLPEDIVVVTQKTREQLFKELQRYYREELNLHDYSKRLGNLMSLVHCAGEAALLIYEEQRMYSTMFDVYSDDRLLREL
ncbi:hypothetical protein PMAYCL1PPCAC_16702, partial [Pristionchus mayeri]